MHPTSFRMISAAISILLLATLVFAIILAVRDNPAAALPRLTPTVNRVAVTQDDASLAATPAAVEDTPDGAAPTTTPDTAPAATPIAAAPAVPATQGNDSAGLPTPTSEDASDGEAGTLAAVPTAEANQASESDEIDNGEAEASATLAPVMSTFSADEDPVVRVYSNGNFANSVAVMRSTVWAATGGGVVAWNKSSGGYVKFTTLDGLTTNQITHATVCPLPGLGVLFASELGVQIFDTQNGRWKTLNSSNSPMRYDDVAAIWCNAATGRLAVGYLRHGLDIFDAGTGDWTYIGADEGLTVSGIRMLDATNDDTLWMATPDGLVAYTNGNDEDDSDGEIALYTTANSPLTNNRIETLAVDGSGAVWLTSGDMLFRTRNDEWDAFSAANTNGSFPTGRLTGLDVGSDGTIWIGSDQAQLCRFDPGIEGCVAFYSGEEGMATLPLTSLTIGGEGEVYYTTAGGGVSMFDGSIWQTMNIPDEPTPGNAIRDLVQDADGALWVAANGGVARLDPSDDSIPAALYSPASADLPAADVRAVQPGVDGGIWVGAEGVSFFDGTEWTNYSVEDGLAGTAVQAIAADDQGRIWVATSTGLSIWTGSTFFNLTTANGLPVDDITALQTDGSIIWIGTRGGGLLRFEDNQLQLFNRSNSNLPSDSITGLARDYAGTLLIATDAGLARFVENALTGDVGLGEVAITALAAAPSGEIWAATADNGLFRFDGTRWLAAPTAQLPAPQITTLLVDAGGDLWIGAAQGGLARYTP